MLDRRVPCIDYEAGWIGRPGFGLLGIVNHLM